MFGNDVNSDWKKESDIWLFTNPAWKNHATRMLGGWSPDNPNSDIPAISNNTANQEQRFSSWFIEDGSYIKLKSITLGYNFQNPFKGVSKLNVYVTGQNLYTITDYTGFDPEVNAFAGTNGVLGIDYGTYPQIKTFVVGLKANF